MKYIGALPRNSVEPCQLTTELTEQMQTVVRDFHSELPEGGDRVGIEN